MKKVLSLSFALAALAALVISATLPDAPTGDGLKIGDKAPDFNLKGVDNTMHSFDNIKDSNGKTPKGYIVVFTCNTCPFAVMYEDRIIELNKKMSMMGYPVIAIQPNDPAVKKGDSFGAMQTRAKEKGFSFLYLFDEGQKVYPQYGASRTPEFYVLDKNRVLRYTGALDDNAEDASAVTVNYVEKAVKSIESGLAPDPSKTKAIGCGIKVKS